MCYLLFVRRFFFLLFALFLFLRLSLAFSFSPLVWGCFLDGFCDLSAMLLLFLCHLKIFRNEPNIVCAIAALFAAYWRPDGKRKGWWTKSGSEIKWVKAGQREKDRARERESKKMGLDEAVIIISTIAVVIFVSLQCLYYTRTDCCGCYFMPVSHFSGYNSDCMCLDFLYPIRMKRNWKLKVSRTYRAYDVRYRCRRCRLM